MLSYSLVSRRRSTHKALTGLNIREFELLLVAFAQAYEETASRDKRCRNIRAKGGGCKGIVNALEDKLLLILIYFKQYPTQELLGMLFGVSQPQACALIHRHTPMLEAALGKKMCLPQRPAASELPQILARVPGMLYVIDGTERPIERPVCPDRQKACYSGKKKRHTIKNTVICDLWTKIIVALGATHPGSVHDKKMADQDRFKPPPDGAMIGDTGYQGFELEDGQMVRPKKKPKGRELSEYEKKANRLISMDRVRVEHAIRGMKISRIVKDVFRNKKKGFDDTACYIAAGIWNYRLSA